jgi:hypothetical protein
VDLGRRRRSRGGMAAGPSNRRLAARHHRHGLPGVRLHDLRHMHVTETLAAGIPVRTVASRVGHSSATMTLNVYGHALEIADRAAADVISTAFSGAARSPAIRDEPATDPHDASCILAVLRPNPLGPMVRHGRALRPDLPRVGRVAGPS